mmetsp:Transcript_16353/g.66080  ORF Transcript_16353/g.66080 Transcript_16353/m.66080 type:complete len:231 (+) Transcript_16353:390-1082(+)
MQSARSARGSTRSTRGFRCRRNSFISASAQNMRSPSSTTTSMERSSRATGTRGCVPWSTPTSLWTERASARPPPSKQLQEHQTPAQRRPRWPRRSATPSSRYVASSTAAREATSTPRRERCARSARPTPTSTASSPKPSSTRRTSPRNSASPRSGASGAPPSSTTRARPTTASCASTRSNSASRRPSRRPCAPPSRWASSRRRRGASLCCVELVSRCSGDLCRLRGRPCF